MSIEEYKQILNLKSDTSLNIYFASWTARELIGLATFPWEKDVLGVLGEFTVVHTLYIVLHTPSLSLNR